MTKIDFEGLLAQARSDGHGSLSEPQAKQALAAMGISSRPSGLMALFSSHPPMEERIARLREAP